MTLHFEPIWSWPVVLAIGVGLSMLVVWTYRSQLAAVPVVVGRGLLGLKLAAVAALIFAMLRPAIQMSEVDETPMQLLVAADVSRSMNTGDMPSKQSRFQAVRADIEKHRAKWKDFSKKIEVREFDFARDLTPFDPNLKEGTGDQTAFGHVLEGVLDETRDRKVLGLILMTDGGHRAVPPFDADALSAARKLADAQIAIYAVGYGASSLSTASLDLAIEDLVVPSVVFEKNRVPVKARLRVSGANGQKARVRVIVEDRTGLSPGKSGEMKPIPSTSQSRTVQEFEIKQDATSIPVELSFAPQISGEVKIGIEVEKADGELLVGNNRRETIITVKKGGLNAAYFDAPRSEVRWLRMVDGADKLQLDYQPVPSGRLGKLTKIDPTWFDPGRYNVYIIGDVPASVFGPELLKKLNDRLEEGAGLLMTGGLQNFAVGGYARTLLADWLPVDMDPADERPVGKFNLATQIPGDIKVVPTEAGLKQYVMQLGSADKNRTLWQELAPLKGATRLKPKNELIQPWATTPDGQPLLLATTIGRARIAAFAGDTTYLWHLVSKQPELHQRFWRQMIFWLANKEADTDAAVWVTVDPRNHAPGGTATLNFGARTIDGLPIEDAEFAVSVENPAGEKIAVPSRKNGGEHFAEFSKTLMPGDYWVRVTQQKDGKPIGFDALTRFIVDSRDLELDYPSADYDFLKELSAITGGLSMKPEDVDDLLERLKASKNQDLTRVQTTPLWDNWWFLAVFVGLMSIEWTLRKKRGMV